MSTCSTPRNNSSSDSELSQPASPVLLVQAAGALSRPPVFPDEEPEPRFTKTMAAVAGPVEAAGSSVAEGKRPMETVILSDNEEPTTPQRPRTTRATRKPRKSIVMKHTSKPKAAAARKAAKTSAKKAPADDFTALCRWIIANDEEIAIEFIRHGLKGSTQPIKKLLDEAADEYQTLIDRYETGKEAFKTRERHYEDTTALLDETISFLTKMRDGITEMV